MAMIEKKNLSTVQLEWEQIVGVFPSGLAVDETPVTLPDGYNPNNNEEFMNSQMREYFRKKLIAWRNEILDGDADILKELQEDNEKTPDPLERASHEQLLSVDLRTKDRQRKLMIKINEALIKIANKTYGYCEVTGQPIDLKRLEARPIATLSREAQESYELEEKSYSDDS